MEFIAAVAIGLNPYIGTFVLAAFAAFTGRLPASHLGSTVPHLALVVLTVLSGLAVAAELVLGKFVRFAPQARRWSQIVAPLSAALWASAMERSDLPSLATIGAAAILAWAVAAMLTALAARASRWPALAGLGHVPVLMAAAVAAACTVPLALAKPIIGAEVAVASVATLTLATIAGVRPAADALSTERAHG